MRWRGALAMAAVAQGALVRVVGQSVSPSLAPVTVTPSGSPSKAPSASPVRETLTPSQSLQPSFEPSNSPSGELTAAPTDAPTVVSLPTSEPTINPTASPTIYVKGTEAQCITKTINLLTGTGGEDNSSGGNQTGEDLLRKFIESTDFGVDVTYSEAYGKSCDLSVDYEARNLTALDDYRQECFEDPQNREEFSGFKEGFCFAKANKDDEFPTLVGVCACVKPPSNLPTKSPTPQPTKTPSVSPTQNPTFSPSFSPTMAPSLAPTQIRFPVVRVYNVAVHFEPTVRLLGDQNSRRGAGSALTNEQPGARRMALQSELDVFEIQFRCYMYFLILRKLTPAPPLQGLFGFDVKLHLGSRDSIVRLMPTIEFNRSCIESIIASNNSGSCSVSFTFLLPGWITGVPTPRATVDPLTLEPERSITDDPTDGPSDGSERRLRQEDNNATNSSTGLPSKSPTKTPSFVPTASPSVTTFVPTIEKKSQFVEFLEELFQGIEVNKIDENSLYKYVTGAGTWSILEVNKNTSLVTVRDTREFAARTYLLDLDEDAKELLTSTTLGMCPDTYELRPVDDLSPGEESAGEGVVVYTLVGLAIVVLVVGMWVILGRRNNWKYYPWNFRLSQENKMYGLKYYDQDKFPNIDAMKGGERSIFRDLEIDVHQLALGPVIGHGANGRIFRAQYCGSDVAVKELFPSSSDDVDGQQYQSTLAVENQDDEWEAAIDPKDQIWREVRNLRLLRHPNVIQLYGCAQARSEDTGQLRFLVVMELASCSLTDLLLENFDRELPFGLQEFDMSRKLSVSKEVCAGLAYIHDSNMIHFDIKPENILLNQAGQAKICDLGIAKLHSGPEQTINMTQSAMGGTPPYMAPEILRASFDSVGTPVDVYAFGIVLWQVFHPESTPYPTNWTMAKLFHEVMVNDYRPTINESVDIDVAELIRRCWNADSRRRPTFHEIIRDLDSILKRTSDGWDKRMRFASDDLSEYMLKEGSEGFFWEHTQRRYVHCTVVRKRVDESQSRALFDITLEKDDIIYRKPNPALTVRFIEQKELDAVLAEAEVKTEVEPSEDEIVRIPQAQSFRSSATMIQLVSFSQTVDSEEENQLESSDEDDDDEFDLTSSDEEEQAEEESTEEKPSTKNKNDGLFHSGADQQRMLKRKFVVESLLVPVSRSDDIPRNCIFDSITLMASQHVTDVLSLNRSLFQTMQTTIARNDSLRSVELSLTFESISSCDGDAATRSSHKGAPGEDTDASGSSASSSLDAKSEPNNDGSNVKELFWHQPEAFENDKMSVCKFADLVPFRGEWEERVCCSAGLHLPSFVIITVKQLRVSWPNTELVDAVQLVSTIWRELYSEHAAPLTATARISRGYFSECPQLVAFYGCYVDQNDQAITLLTEYVDGGSLQDVLDGTIGPDYDEDNGKESSKGGSDMDTVGGALLPVHDQSLTEDRDIEEEPIIMSGEEVASLEPERSTKPCENCPPDFVMKSTAICNEAVLANIAQSVLTALVYLHKKKRIHGGIKPSNILINTAGDIKLADFGLYATKAGEVALPITNNFLYLSPERLQGGAPTTSGDVWALGMTLLTVALGHHPFEVIENDECLAKSLERHTPINLPSDVPFPPPKVYFPVYDTSYHFSSGFRAFLASILTLEASDRPSVEDLLAHPWLTNSNKSVESVRKGVAAEHEEKLIADISNAVVQRAIGSLESRKYLCGTSSTQLVIRRANIERLARQLSLSAEMVVESFIYNADLAGIQVRSSRPQDPSHPGHVTTGAESDGSAEQEDVKLRAASLFSMKNLSGGLLGPPRPPPRPLSLEPMPKICVDDEQQAGPLPALPPRPSLEPQETTPPSPPLPPKPNWLKEN